MNQGERLIGWKEINAAIYAIARISEDTAKRRARKFGVPLPLHYDGYRIWCVRDDLKRWWADIEKRTEARWEARRRLIRP